ncbi:MAG: phosphoribosyltransferase family protein [Candidatus Dojkabacteria bacterium]|nr:phosphoribosyltransferase family protein [Candidatus Dojkabacteria bacterium]
MHLLKNLKERLKCAGLFLQELFFPAFCEGCGETGSCLCESCLRQKICIRKAQQCHVCKKIILRGLIHSECKSKTSLSGVFIAVDYSKFIENYIGDIKYEFYYKMIDDLIPLFQKAFKENDTFHRVVSNSIFTFVPLHSKRKRWRGFNQSELLAKKLSVVWKVECKGVLARKRKTKSQVGLNRKERLENLKGAFEVKDSQTVRLLNGQSMIIVDDVMTSGGTLEECALVLKRAGVRNVYGLVVARG